DPEAITVHDLDHRPMFWDGIADAREQARRALTCATVVVGNLDEGEMAVGTRDPAEAAPRPLDPCPGTGIGTGGPDGVFAMTRDEEVDLDPVRLDVVNGVGAGDAFGGALVHGLVRELPLERTLQLANAAGALVASRLACADAMPELDELEALVG